MKKWVIVGLGNPGSQYVFTRHNLGFLVVDELAQRLHINFKSNRSMQCEYAHYKSSYFEIRLIKPTTYMNASGNSLKAILDYYNHIPQEIIVVADDVMLPLGVIRSRSKGSSGGHNGLKSIARCLKTDEYIRMRLGVKGAESEFIPMKEYVLNRFSEKELSCLPEIVDQAAKMLYQMVEKLSQPDPVYVEEIVHHSKTIIEQEKII